MKIDKSLIEQVAEVARLQLSKADMKNLASDLIEVLDTFSKLKEVDTKNTQSSFQPVPLKNHTRDDIKKECLSQEQALANVKEKKDGYIKGPRVV
ncbi:MAG: Asp-tRNA(Asn)/Glu-tRNA(Gln) amidotransferase subunit GatC [Nanoarchaeota archaeon]|nr:Asp-tRNA(Asn)/Glu-tRNA(Gln) amidotransferase subunit GatC [Nanoarchaeota archaeon]